MQQKTGLKNALLQRRINTLNNVAENREALIGELTGGKKVPYGLNEKFDVSINCYFYFLINSGNINGK